MKKIIFISALYAMFCNITHAQQAGEFSLKGKINGLDTGKMVLYYMGTNGKSVKDSAMVKNGEFIFKGNINEPSSAYLVGDVKSQSMDDPNSRSLFIEPSAMTITLALNDFKHAKITGSKTQEEAEELDKICQPIYDEMQPLSIAYTKINQEYIDAMKSKQPQAFIDSLHEKAAAMHDEFGPFQDKIANIDYRFFAGHPNSYVTAFQLRFYVSSLTFDSLQMFYNNMNSQLQHSSAGQNIAKEIDKLKSGSPGSVAKVFAAKDINGNNLSLADFKGKYVLLDFWASWCIPCRHSNPHLKELYAKYHDKGFEIIGVSDDDKHEDDWKKAVAKDGIDIWHHVLRGLDMDKLRQGIAYDSDISEKYGIHSLPTKILIDKNGVIIGRYDKGTDEEKEEMDKKIAEAMN